MEEKYTEYKSEREKRLAAAAAAAAAQQQQQQQQQVEAKSVSLLGSVGGSASLDLESEDQRVRDSAESLSKTESADDLLAQACSSSSSPSSLLHSHSYSEVEFLPASGTGSRGPEAGEAGEREVSVGKPCSSSMSLKVELPPGVGVGVGDDDSPDSRTPVIFSSGFSGSASGNLRITQFYRIFGQFL